MQDDKAISTECLEVADMPVLAQPQCDLDAADLKLRERGYGSLRAAAPPANVREWEALYKKILPDLYKGLSTCQIEALRKHIDQQLRSNCQPENKQ